jgi:hypothetical protein
MFSLLYRRSLCLGSLFIVAIHPYSQTSHATPATPTPRVNVETATKIFIASDSAAYLVSFSYHFDNLPNIYIKGLGVVRSKGSFQYISREQELEFCDPTSGALLERVPFQETTVVAAKPPLNEVPPDTAFSAGYRSYTWESPASLQERANAVLAKYFNYQPHENNKLTYLATTYTQLPLNKKLADRGVLAQLALLLSFPYDPAQRKYSFHVQYSAKEGRPLSDELRATNDGEILGAANEFVDKIVAEMRSAE